MRKVPNQSQPVTGRKISADDEDNEDVNEIFQSQADKGNIFICKSNFTIFSHRKHSINIDE
jgi:hypothetical protein